MRNPRSVAASLATAAVITTSAVTVPQALAQTTVVAGYSVEVDAANESCTITPTAEALASTAAYRKAMWPDAERAIDSLELSWSQDQKDKIVAAIDAGARSTDTAVTTPLAALEAASIVKTATDVTKTGTDLINSVIESSFIGSLIPVEVSAAIQTALAFPTSNVLIQLAVSAINGFIPTDKQMLSGELSTIFVNPAVDASHPFTVAAEGSEGQTFTFDEAAKESEKYQKQIITPQYAAPIGDLIRSEAAEAQVKLLSEDFKKAWASYNQDAVNALAACAAPEESEEAEEAPQPDPRPGDGQDPSDNPEPSDDPSVDPSEDESAGESEGDKPAEDNPAEKDNDPQPSDKGPTTQDSADGSSTDPKPIIISTVVIAALAAILAILPALKPILPPEIARLLP